MKAGLLGAAPPLGRDPPRTKQKWGWSRVMESGYRGGAAAAERPGWASTAERTALLVVHVSARSAFQRPVVSPPVHNGCTPPGRNRRGPGRGQRWTCLETTKRKAFAATPSKQQLAVELQIQRYGSTFCTAPCLRGPKSAPMWVKAITSNTGV